MRLVAAGHRPCRRRCLSAAAGHSPRGRHSSCLVAAAAGHRSRRRRCLAAAAWRRPKGSSCSFVVAAGHRSRRRRSLAVSAGLSLRRRRRHAAAVQPSQQTLLPLIRGSISFRALSATNCETYLFPTRSMPSLQEHIAGSNFNGPSPPRGTQQQPTPRGRRPPLYPWGGGSSLWPQKKWGAA
jgi:hypothetical protein